MPGNEISQEAEFAYLLGYARQNFFDEEICRERLRILWTAYCLHQDLDVDTAKYDTDLLSIWTTIEENSDSIGWDSIEMFDYFMCGFLV